MNVLKLKTTKLWILLTFQIRLDMKARFVFWATYAWIFLLCLTNRFLFEIALLRPTILFGGSPISFPLFVMSGIAVYRFAVFTVVIIDETILNLRRSGVMDWILVTPTSLYELFFVRAIWKSFLGLTEAAVIIFFSHLLIGIPIKPFLQGSVFYTLAILSFAYIGIGMSIASVALLLRRGSFLCSVVQQVSCAFGGVFFPVYLLPKVISFIPQVLPINHALNIVRFALTHAGQTVSFPLFVPLIEIAIIYLVLGFFMLRKSLSYARQTGLLLKDLHG